MTLKLRPNTHRVIIVEKIVEEKIGSIFLPQDRINAYQNAQCEGRIVSMASNAFDFLPENERPSIGTIVHFDKYDGLGKMYNKIPYRVVVDESISHFSDEYLSPDEDVL